MCAIRCIKASWRDIIRHSIVCPPSISFRKVLVYSWRGEVLAWFLRIALIIFSHFVQRWILDFSPARCPSLIAPNPSTLEALHCTLFICLPSLALNLTFHSWSTNWGSTPLARACLLTLLAIFLASILFFSRCIDSRMLWSFPLLYLSDFVPSAPFRCLHLATVAASRSALIRACLISSWVLLLFSINVARAFLESNWLWWLVRFLLATISFFKLTVSVSLNFRSLFFT